MDEFGRIDTGPPPAVKSLRSRFEQLALDASQKPNPSTTTSSRQNGSNDLLAPGGQSSPRQRTTSGSFTHSSADSEFPQHHLRSTSSSSDLQFGINRPPPPPPRGPKATPPSPVLSPSPSTLLRPVPIPPGVSSGAGLITSPRVGFSSLPSVSNRSVLLVDLSQDSEVLESPVAPFRGKFSTIQPKSLHSPRASICSVYPSAGSGPPSSTLNSSPKPVIPPRPPRPSSSAEMTSTPTFLQIPQKRHSDESTTWQSLSVSPDQRASLHSPFSNDESTEEVTPAPTAPPPPSRSARKSQPLSDFHEDTVRSSLPPPRPPPRIRGTASPAVFVDSPGSSSSSLSSLSTSTSATPTPPPPLPARRSTFAHAEEPPPKKPRLPTRPPQPFQLSIPSHAEASSSASPTTTERKALGSGRLPPPPTRTIALGEKLPPARRPPSPSSDEDSDDEADSKAPTVDLLPDSSRSSRRPPVLSFREGSTTQPRITVHAFSGHFCLSGTTAVAAQHHHVRMYDLVVGDVAMHTVDLREAGGGMSKDIKVTSMEFRSCREKEDRGQIVWLGTKEGGLVEMDTRSGAVKATRWAAHPHPVTHIFRCGRAMVTLDDGGKVLIWAPESADGDDVDLVKTHPRVMRIAEKQDFVKMVGGKLWTAARVDQVSNNGTTGGVGATKVPVLRVYDLFKLGNVGKTVTPTEHVGAVTSATIIPSRPDHVYIGHEEGFVSVWLLAADDGIPKCEEVMKVSTSDVLCLEGVNDRLWAGGRSGLISAYDTTQKPWVVTNCWNAHPGLPVVKLGVDAMGIGKTGRLCVVSVGRDEVVRFWDGLLGLDWVEEELLKRENSFSHFRNLSVLLVSWNCDSARPDSLTGDPANVNFLTDVLHSVDSPDIVSFGFQEVIDLESRRMAAKNVLLGSKKGQEGVLSDKVTGAYKRWYDRLTTVMRQAMPPNMAYTVVHTESLVGLFTCVFVKQSEKASLRDIAITTVKRGMGGRYGNKGGIVARFVVDDSSICLINCHLAAGQNHVRQRNADVTGMLEEKAVFPETDLPLAYIGGGDGSMVLDHEIVFVNGDMNYRIDHRRDAIVSAVRANDLTSLLSHDQLLREIKHNRACRFRDFSEGPITFMPTYKYDPRTDEYDSSEKRRSPAWCDRVLWRTRDPSRVQQLHYQRYEANVSDHRPISAAFMITVKSVRHEVREKVKKEVQEMWMDQQIRLLLAAREFYIREALV